MAKKNDLITERGADFIGQLVFKDEKTNQPKNMVGSVVSIEISDTIEVFNIPTTQDNVNQNIFHFHVPNTTTINWNSNIYDFKIIEKTNGIKTIDRTKLWVE